MSRGTLGIIGCGNMAEAIVAACLEKKVFSATSIIAGDRDPEKARAFQSRFGIATRPDNRTLVADSDLVLFAVKPQDAPAVLSDVAPLFFANRMIAISIAAGLPIATITRVLGDTTPIVRVMPNTPIRIGRGASVCMANPTTTPDELARVVEIFQAGGLCHVISEESLFDAVTALSGSGPAYVFLFIEALEAAARDLGLPEDLILPMIYQTLDGATQLAKGGDHPPAVLRAQVTSKGGTTEAALRILDDHHFIDIFKTALRAARDRARTLSAG